MKTCGLQHLYLISPQTLIDEKSRAMAAGATDILDGAKSCDKLIDAIGDCAAVFAYTARRRDLSPPQRYSAQAGELAAKHIRRGERIALLFGGEQSGLDNDSLRAANYAVEIPANPIIFLCAQFATAMARANDASYDLRRALIAAPECHTRRQKSPGCQHSEMRADCKTDCRYDGNGVCGQVGLIGLCHRKNANGFCRRQKPLYPKKTRMSSFFVVFFNFRYFRFGFGLFFWHYSC